MSIDTKENGWFTSIISVYNRIQNIKKNMELACPGSFDGLHREARNVSLNHLLFEGGKLELGKLLSPQFQMSHSMNLGSSSISPTYYFASALAGSKNMIHGMIDSKGELQGKLHYSLTDSFIFKSQMQVAKSEYSMLQLEGDYLGADYSINIKTINPNLINGTGIFTAGYLQSITKNLTLGIEGIIQRHASSNSNHSISVDSGIGYIGKYQWGPGTLTIQTQNLMAIQASYFHKVNETVELGSELQCVIAGPQTEAVASMGCKLEYRQSILRAQLDTLGRVALFLEERLFGRVSLLLSGEIDHIKGKSRFGVGLSMEN